MNLEIKVIKNTLIVVIKGEIDMREADEMRTYIDKNIEKNKIYNLVFNLEKVSFIDSSGLGVIIGRYKKMMSRDGKTYIVGANDTVKKILVFSGINKIIPLYKSEQEIVNI